MGITGINNTWGIFANLLGDLEKEKKLSQKKLKRNMVSWIPRNGTFTSLDFREACNLLGVENLGAGERILGE